MDPSNDNGIQIGPGWNPPSAQTTTPNAIRRDHTELGVGRNQKAEGKECCIASATRDRPISEPVISSPKEGRLPKTGYQSKASESVHSEAKVQNGGSETDSGPASEEGLDDLDRPERRVSF